MASKYINKTLSETTKEMVKHVCKLESLEPKNHSIKLTSGKVITGRSKETGVQDVCCSKRQLEFDVDEDNKRIKLRVLGVNPSSVNGLMVMQNTECEVKNGDIIELVYGKHPYKVKFNSSEKSDTTATPKAEKTGSDNKAITSNDTESWDSVGNGKMLVYTSAGVRSSDKIAGYDVDGTIIRTKSGNVFPKNTEDWQLNYPEVSKKLKNLHESEFKICFFTNQGGIGKGKVNVDEFKQKMIKIIKRVGVPVQAFIAISDGHYRKPLTGMWDYLRDHKNDGIQIKLEKSFFVGDAAGRPEIGTGATKRKKDHAFADRFFAANIGLSFYTPEEHFLGKKKEQWTTPEFEPSNIDDNIELLSPGHAEIPSKECELIIMVGLPGSGKSHFCKHYLSTKGYTVANADTLGSTQACLKACEKILNRKESCVVDNTNVDAESRKKFIDLAKKLNIPCRCFVMNVTLAQVKHNIAYRQLVDVKHSKINEMVLNTMKKKYKAPEKDEGFAEIVKVNLKPKFNDANEEKLYKLYLTEK